jgi:hypothetical protein
MMKLIYRVLLTANSIILLLMVYFVKEKIWIKIFGIYTVILYALIPLCLAFICILLSHLLSNDCMNGDILGIELANDAYLPSYLGYFFVALSIPTNDILTLLFVFSILFLFVFCSQALYYNPLFLILGYKFYYVTNSKSMKIFIISKRELRICDSFTFNKLKRINNYTFIDREDDL